LKRIIAIVFCAVLLCGSPVWASGSAGVIKVMTRNQYLGADLTPVILSQTPQEFVAAATTALQQIAANDFPRRAKGLAREVLLTQPDVIGLQEVFNFTLNGRNGGAPFIDHLQQTLNALSSLGLRYVVAATVQNLDLTIPLDINGDGMPEAVRVLDRDVILVKQGVSFTALRGSYLTGGLCGVPVPNPAPVAPFPAVLASTPSQDGCTYEVIASVNTPLGRIDVSRGFVGVDVVVGGTGYRVINTHLEIKQPDPTNPASAIIQFLQSVELAGTLVATTPANKTLIALGDFNSSPVDAPVSSIVPPYQVMALAGFADAWNTNTLAALDPDGFTCCQQADLANKKSLHSERIDLILLRTARRFVPFAVVTGQFPLLTPFRPPNWASDHGGVFGILVFPN
jgi:endonuclease/exonuclease/phosphatase family metal-dependent hydrolase